MNYFEIFIMSVIEGLTEFLPVSSTGHLVLTAQALRLESSDFLKAFEVIIQFGAIMAVVVLYRKKFFNINIEFYKKIIYGSIPIMGIGFLVKNKIDEFLDNPSIVAWALIIGGVIFIITDKMFNNNIQDDEVTTRDSIKVGIMQCVALIPGVSRSGATIIGSQALGYTQRQAAEFSFFLAVPTLTAATLYKTYKIRHILNAELAPQLIVGIVLSFIFALFAIKFFIEIVKKYGFKWFGIYRILLGLVVLFFSR